MPGKLAIGPVDLSVLCLYVLAVVALGMWVGRRQRALSDYLLAGRRLPGWAILISIVATETSTVTFLSVTGLSVSGELEGGVGDLRFIQLAIGYVVGRHLIVLLLLPQFFAGRLYTAYEVLHRRFGPATKQGGSLLFIVTRNLADGFRLFLTAVLLQKVTGLSMTWAIGALGLATIVYTFFGGMRAVIWTDCLQFVVYMAGAGVAAALILQALPDGWATLVEYGRTHESFRAFDFRLDLTSRYTFWAGLIGGGVLTLGTHGVDQLMVQRYLCARSLRSAGWALGLSGWVVLVQFLFFLLLGVGLGAYYDPAYYPGVPPSFEKADEVFATFIVDELPVGLVGVLLAAVFSAAMSTLSSSLNSASAAAINDFYLPLRGGDPSDRERLRTSRLLTVGFGVIQIAVALSGGALAMSVVHTVLLVQAFAMGILLGVFMLGVLTRSVGQTGALIGGCGGIAMVATLKLTTGLAWPWFVVAGAVGTFLVGCAADAVLTLGSQSEHGDSEEP